jgi:hypothetical protein
MKFLALEIEKQTIDWSEVPADLLKDEAHRVYELQQAGYIRQIHYRADTKSAVIDWECDAIEQVKELTNSLPLVQAGYIEFNIMHLIPYPGFERLFFGY